ncbi:hypothetical protein [Gluconobacter sp. GP1]|uniref:hypothetical protein n=1 Tax=Gluconobacter sp. GP1 TaxID=3046423 RepID=UPI00293F2C5A|nr:hypothetical protein [Gluconobacter sp. GP1]
MSWSTIQTLSGWGGAILIFYAVASNFFEDFWRSKKANRITKKSNPLSETASVTDRVGDKNVKSRYYYLHTYLPLIFSLCFAVLSQVASQYVGDEQEHRFTNIETKEAGRSLTTKAQEDLYSRVISISSNPQKVIFMISSCPDCYQFAESIASPLRKAGWEIVFYPAVRMNRKIFSHGISFMARSDNAILEAICSSLLMYGFDNLEGEAGEPVDNGDIQIFIYPDPVKNPTK